MSRPILSQRHSPVTWLAPIAINVNGHAPIAITVASRLHGLAPIAIQRTAAQLNPTQLNSTRNASQPNSTQLNSPIRNSYHTSPQMRSAEVMISFKPLEALPKRHNRRPKRNGSLPPRVAYFHAYLPRHGHVVVVLWFATRFGLYFRGAGHSAKPDYCYATVVTITVTMSAFL